MEDGEMQKAAMKLKKIKTKEEEPRSPKEITRQAMYNASPRGAGNGGSFTAKQKINCLCAPTTHAGSFRCRYHRIGTPTGLPRGRSVGSNLSLFASKSHSISDSLNAQ